jgi:hypothetical protein
MGVIWSVYSLRLNAVILATVLIIMLALGSLPKRPWLVVWMSALVLAFPFQPIEVTVRTIPGGPKLLRSCPGTPYRDYRAALRMDAAGVCAFCSDLSNGFNASRYWVW